MCYLSILLICPFYCGPYYTTPHPVTEPPCHDCDDTCPPYHKPTTTKFPNLPSITYSTNCDFCDHDLYTLTCVATPFDCAGCCAADSRCSHFTYSTSPISKEELAFWKKLSVPAAPGRRPFHRRRLTSAVTSPDGPCLTFSSTFASDWTLIRASFAPERLSL
jgi:hypothetical protein